MDGLLVLQQVLDRLDVLLADRVQQGVFHLDPLFQEQLYQLDVLVLDRRDEGRPVERVNAIDVELGRFAPEVGDYPEKGTNYLQPRDSVRDFSRSTVAPSHSRRGQRLTGTFSRLATAHSPQRRSRRPGHRTG